ncbi:MAG: NADPH-dependent assimilatory sulfite reductase hemoprotein subunit [Gemmatimonadota bacterium]
MATRDKTAESAVEIVKRSSRQLRGTIEETIGSDATHFATGDLQLLKFHGTYQQDDRDRRRGRSEGEEKAYWFMLRVALPAGLATAAQYLAFDDLADRYANGTLRITTRQGLQYHGVLKGDLKPTIAAINHALATTLSACGDVQRNVMGCPAALDDPAHAAVRDAARAIAEELRPASRAYHEIWLDGERQISTEEEEPFYGETYLPRKFKTAVALASDNCVDIYSHDVGLVAITDGPALRAFNVLVGGGLGMTHGKGDTMARLAEPLGSVAPEDAAGAVKIVAAIFRDHGNRADRRHARLKYLIHEWGIERFREEFRARALFPLNPSIDLPSLPWHDHLGLTPERGGRWSYGVYVPSGRVADGEHQRYRTALREAVSRYNPGVVFTAQQNVLLTGLTKPDAVKVERLLAAHGVTPPHALAAARRFSMACPALPTCGLAVAESERLLPAVVDQFEEALTRLGVRDVPITIRMTGCPNGCARPYTADLAFVGRSLGLYHVYVGGGLAADRLADLYRADVRTDALLEAVYPLLERWANERTIGEGLGDFYQRLRGRAEPRLTLTGKEEPTAGSVEKAE